MLTESLMIRIGYYAGSFSLVVLFTSLIWALIVSPDYSFYIQTISKLGVTKQGALPFTLGICITGVLLLIFCFFYLRKAMPNIIEVKIANLSGIVAGMSMIGIGIFPDTPASQVITILHLLAAAILFISVGLLIALYSKYLFQLTGKYENLLAKIGVTVVIIIIGHLFFSFLNSPVKLTEILVLVPSVVWQKITVIASTLWYLLFLYYCWKRRYQITATQ
jgi:hypothetical protein